MHLYRFSLAVIPALILVACDREPVAQVESSEGTIDSGQLGSPGPMPLIKADQSRTGSVVLKDTSDGVSLAIDVRGLRAGMHGVHLHAVGKCEGPKFESAGAHWNPTSSKHGRDNPQGAHLGDLANVDIGADGSGKTIFAVGATQNALADADGTSLMIHAEADDYKTDPSGNSGNRVACSVVSPPR